MTNKSLFNRVRAIEKTLAAGRRVLTFDEACLYTCFAKSYMYKLTSSGKIPYSKPNGKVIFFDREKLDQWLLSGSRTVRDIDAEASTHVAKYPAGMKVEFKGK